MAKTNPLAKAIAKAWKDPAFKKKLLADPKAALKETGFEIPKDITVKVVEDTPKSLTVVLPYSPQHANEMSGSELEKLAAGLGYGYNIGYGYGYGNYLGGGAYEA